MKCVLCEQEGTYRLRVANHSWSNPLEVDGVYCSLDVRRVMRDIDHQIGSQIPVFEVVNTPKPPAVPTEPPIPLEPVNEPPEQDKTEEPEEEDYSKYVTIKPSKSKRYVSSPEWRERRRLMVKKLWDEGMRNTYDIAERLGETRGSIYSDLRMLGIKPKENKFRKISSSSPSEPALVPLSA